VVVVEGTKTSERTALWLAPEALAVEAVEDSTPSETMVSMGPVVVVVAVAPSSTAVVAARAS
jgi:hypothetical protein